MSIALMTEAWKLDIPAGPKFVLLSLCDNANDQGECYPAIATIAERCSMGVRTVQGHVQQLVDWGFMRRIERAGRSTVYAIDPRRIRTPADFAPPQNLRPTPAKSAPPPPQISHPTPAEPAPITVNEPSIEPSRKRKSAQALIVPDVPAELLADYLKVRGAKKAGPLTETALAGLRREAEHAGVTLSAALTICCERGWQGFKAEWLAIPQQAGQRQTQGGRFAAASRTIFGGGNKPADDGRTIDA